MSVVIKLEDWIILNSKLKRIMNSLKDDPKNEELLKQCEILKKQLEELDIYNCNHILVESKEAVHGDMYNKWYYKTECVKCGLSDEWGYDQSYYQFKELRTNGKIMDYLMFPSGEYHNLDSIREKYLEALSIAVNPLNRDEIVRLIIGKVSEENAIKRQRVNTASL